MSLKDVSNMYEKMLENPKNRISSSGTIKQPTPFDGQANNPISTGEDLNTEETDYLADVDRRMALRAAGEEVNESETEEDVRIAKLEKDITELQELMTEMMKTHMKLLEKIK